MLTVSEVANPGKLASRALIFGLFFLCALGARGEEKPGDGLSMDRLGDCKWQVTYRGRNYDLSPLTREALSRPIENDIRYALQRVPEANEHLELLASHLHAARTETIVTSILAAGILGAWAARSIANDRLAKHNYAITMWSLGGLALTSAAFSWRSTVKAKEELVHAVEEFNNHSAYKIEPAASGLGATE